MFSKVFSKMLANFVPQEDTEACITVYGTVAVHTQTPTGKEWADKDANIYPEELLTDFPVFTIAKSVDQVKVGDIVKLTKSTFATVTNIADGKIETLSFGGQHRQAKAFKDMFLGQATVRVVVNPLAGVDSGNMNQAMMALAMLNKSGDDRGDAFETMMLASMLSGVGQNPMGNFFSNPIMTMAMFKGNDDSIKNIMLMNAMQNGGFASMFGGIAQAAPAAVAPAQAAE